MDSQFPAFIDALEQRHLADLRFSEVTRALRALSSTYVERRQTALAANKALDGAGKRAAFALYYGPLHYLLIDHIVRALGPSFEPGVIVDVGCGSGVGGAAIAAATRPPARILAVDTHPWPLDEARFTFKSLGLNADVRRGHAAKLPFPPDTSVVVAAFVVNELNAADRQILLDRLIRLRTDAAARRRHVLIVEPISERISPWWTDWANLFVANGGRADTWKVPIDAPPIVTRLAKASGLRPALLTARSLFF
ncbi:MAG TPA: class I SAM-dependent methyltransferase [Xanthobacteraceae bacterium]|nr:class I SAM-dependent methyltransferase [Xanthobacteraceae bacterium]